MIETNQKRLATVKNTAAMYQNAISESGLRWIIFNEKTNGFNKCTRRLGRKVLIDLDQFESWIESKGHEGLIA